MPRSLFPIPAWREFNYASDAGRVGSHPKYLAQAESPETAIRKGEAVSLSPTAQLLSGALPPLSLRANFGNFVSGSVGLFDVEVGPAIDMVQVFELTHGLMVDLSFDKQVDLAGVGLRNERSGLWSDLPDVRRAETTLTTPAFHTPTTLHITTRLDFEPQFNRDQLEGNIAVGSGAAAAYKEDFGPVFNTGANPSFNCVARFDDALALCRFNMLDC